MNYQVNEIFDSVQGEGRLSGKPSTFIRLQGCTVQCPWCDSGPLAETIKNSVTKNTWGRGGRSMRVSDIVGQVHLSNVVITGGEPTLYDLDELMYGIRSTGSKTIQLETSGQNELKGTLLPDWITWSPKPNLNFSCAELLSERVDEVKWVVDSDLSIDKIIEVMKRISTWRDPYIVLMPEGYPPSTESINKAMDYASILSNMPFGHRVFYGHRLQYVLGVR